MILSLILEKAEHSEKSLQVAHILSFPYSFSPIYFSYLFIGLNLLSAVEFQKRGLPHIHCLVWLAASTADVSASVIDGFICAEIPDYDTDRLGYELVSEFMMHGPCGDANKNCPCMKNGKC